MGLQWVCNQCWLAAQMLGALGWICILMGNADLKWEYEMCHLVILPRNSLKVKV